MMDDTRLGALLLEGNLVREEDLERCLEFQTLTGGCRPLGQVLIELQVITEEDLEEILRLQRSRRSAQAQAPIDGPTGVDRVLATAVAAGATDLILTEGKPTMVRIAGVLRALTDEPLHPPEMWQFLLDHMGPQVLDRLAAEQYVSQEIVEGCGRGRMTAFRHFGGACCSVRLHPSQPRTPKEAGLSDEVVECVRAGRGLLLLAGRKHSGLTSTLATLLTEAVKGSPRLVVVLGEALEYAIPESESQVIFRRVGRDTVSYEAGLESAIREDADVIIVADVSSPRTFDMALRAAEAGRFVIAGLSARTVQEALVRVQGFYPEYDQRRVRVALAGVLSCVLRIQLVPDRNGTADVMATELLLLDESSRAVLREGYLQRLHLLMNIEDGLNGHSMDACLEELFRAEKISLEDAFQHADDKARFLRRAKARENVEIVEAEAAPVVSLDVQEVKD